MGLPAPLLNALSELEQEAEEIAAGGGSQAPIEVLSEQAKRIEDVLAKARPMVEEMFAEIERSAKAVGAASQASLDEAIEQLYARELALAAKLLPMLQAARSSGKQSFRAQHLTPADRSRHVLVLERLARALSAFLSIFRDERWRMMALRAEIEPAGDAPVFSDPNQLLEYLQANRK